MNVLIADDDGVSCLFLSSVSDSYQAEPGFTESEDQIAVNLEHVLTSS
jgi:hypothetical protein